MYVVLWAAFWLEEHNHYGVLLMKCKWILWSCGHSVPWDPLSSPGQQGDLHTYTTWSYSSKTSKATATATYWTKKDIIKQRNKQNKNKILQTILVNASWKRFLQVMFDGRLFPPSLLSHFWNEERMRSLKTCQRLFFIWWIIEIS